MQAGRVLIVSPIPSEPRDQGNSARIAAMGEALQAAGWVVHFLYHKLEGLHPAQAAAMQACWDHFHVMPQQPRPPVIPAGGGSMALDDWYDPTLSEFAAALHRKWRFAAVLVNYVWCSAVLEAFDGSVTRVIDTHDVFGGRDKRFRELSLTPAWYFTTPAEEARGLARADIVLAIQEDEEAAFRALGHSDVRTLGHLLPLRRRAPAAAARGLPTAGYLASGNPLNLAAFLQLRDALASQTGPSSLARLVVAGTICRHLHDPQPFEPIGAVDHTDSFYDQVQLVLNPMPGGTGLKIKSVEAVHLGVPLVATVSAMIGLPTSHAAHALRDPVELAEYVHATAWTPALILELQRASEACAATYAEGVRAAYRRLLSDLGRGGRCGGSQLSSYK